MFKLGLGGDRTSSPPRRPLIDWPRVAPYGLTLLATLALGWALAQLG